MQKNFPWEILLFIYIASACYVLAAYYHTRLTNWTFTKAMMIAVPLVVIEYSFSLRGNYLAHKVLQMGALQILLITMTFYFINTWLLNIFVLKHKVIWWRELTSFALIMLAFYITTSIKH